MEDVKLLQRIKWHDFPNHERRSLLKSDKKLNIGFFGSRDTRELLDASANIFLLDHSCATYSIKYGNIDFIILEPHLFGEKGGSSRLNFSSLKEGGEIGRMIEMAKENGIPSILFLKEPVNVIEADDYFLSLFDGIIDFTLRENCTGKVIKKSSIVNPMIFNQIGNFEDEKVARKGIVLDGWPSMEKDEWFRDIVFGLEGFGLSVIDSDNRVFKSKLKNDQNSKFYLGSTCIEGRAYLFKRSKYFIAHFGENIDPVRQRQFIVEALASGLIVFVCRKLKGFLCDALKEACIFFDTEFDLKFYLYAFEKDDLYRSRVAHLGWRLAIANFSVDDFSQMILSDICNSDYDVLAEPLCSLIAPTFRVENVDYILDNYVNQTYKNKELIIVCNGDFVEIALEKIKKRNLSDSARCVYVPSFKNASECMNAGIAISQGFYVFRLDDDDPYGNNYILDMVLMNKSVNADIFGKAARYITFEDGSCFRRETMSQPLSCFDSSFLDKTWIAGHSMSGKREFFIENPFPVGIFGAADSALLSNIMSKEIHCALFDEFNLAAFRYDDVTKHTWQVNRQDLERRFSKKLEDLSEVFV